MCNKLAEKSNLNRQRRSAVQLRLDGLKLSEISERTNLSAPTIIAAHKAYLKGGWSAVDVKPRGRQQGDGQLPSSRQTQLRQRLYTLNPEAVDSAASLWTYDLATSWLHNEGHTLSKRTTQRYLQRWGISIPNNQEAVLGSNEKSILHWVEQVYTPLVQNTRLRKARLLWGGVCYQDNITFFYAQTLRKRCLWLCKQKKISDALCIDFFQRLQRHFPEPLYFVFKGIDPSHADKLNQWLTAQSQTLNVVFYPLQKHFDSQFITTQSQNENGSTNQLNSFSSSRNSQLNMKTHKLDATNPGEVSIPEANAANHNFASASSSTHLKRLEAESIHIMREAIADAEKPVMLYSVGKDSSVMLHIAKKAFYPAPPPFPLLHVDTTWKFRAMYEFRDYTAKESGLELITHINPQGREQEINPFTHGSEIHTDIMKTQALKQAIDLHGFDVALAGARRDEEASRAKERVFSFRNQQHRWEPKNQRPELWQLYNTRLRKGESLRVFPLSNWTELDIWQYIQSEDIPVVPLYFAAERPVVERDGMLVMVDDDRMPLHEGEIPALRTIRFRTLGCYPLTGAVESQASNVSEIIQETLQSQTSERNGRMIDRDSAASMEKKKHEGYF